MSTAARDELLALIAEISDRLGPIPGRYRIVAFLRRAAAEHDARVAELLAANNREVNRRRTVEDELRRLLIAVEQVEYIGLDEDLYQAALSGARAVLAHA